MIRGAHDGVPELHKFRPCQISSGAHFRYDRDCAVVAGGSASDHLIEGRDTMFIIVPLALIGVGFMIYLLFAAATYMLPLYVCLTAAFAALHAGASYTSALLLGIITFLFVILFGQMATQLLPFWLARLSIALLFALPAAIAGFQVASALLHFGNMGSWSIALSLAAGLATGIVAARRHQYRLRG
jgi:hypothetical protein